MHPVLLKFSFGGAEVVLGSYRTFYILAWLVAPVLAAWIASRRGTRFRTALGFYAACMVAGIIGARLFDIVTVSNFYAEDPSRMWALSTQGFSLYGGLGAATLAAALIAHVRGLPLWRLLDASAPAVGVGIALMRTGCFLKGCCFGHPTDVLWGVSFPVGSPAWTYQFGTGQVGIAAIFGEVLPVHPYQLYELVGALVLGAVSLALMRAQRVPDGVPILVFAIGFTVLRAVIAPYRVLLSTVTAPAWLYPALYAVVVVVLAVLLVARVRAGRAARS